jgi:S-formylglutathione hydrolase FrmB
LSSASLGATTRRRLLALAALIVAGVVVWLLVREARDLVGTDHHGADVETVTVDSKAVGEELKTSVVIPDDAGSDERSLLVFLHGRDGNEDSELGNEELFETLSELGDRAPIIALPDGGGDSYWHDRADGQWGTYVTDEVIPKVVKEFDADPDRLAIGGISMGGFGAYDIARLHPGRFCAVGGHSPALWQTGGETAPGAFDDAEDFAAHDMIASVAANPGAFTGQPIWLDSGDEDPFVPGDDAFAAALEAAGAPLTEKRWPGGHDHDYWGAHWDEYLRFYANALARC